MGLSSSQARLLNLTARMHDIEYKAQNLEAQKLQMANESRHVYQEYENALNKQKIQFKHIGTDGSATYKDASIQTLLTNKYRVKIQNKGEWNDVAFTTSNSVGLIKSVSTTETTFTSDYTPTDANIGDTVKNGSNYFVLSQQKSDPAKGKGYEVTVEVLTIPTGENKEGYEALRNMVEAGFIVFEKPMTDGTYSEVNIATDTSLQEVTDEVDLKKAEAKYEADMRKINAKDKKFDTDLAALEQERNAIKTEIDTLKTVAKENVERTFKLFS